MDRLTSMTVFARVAARGSFSAAARELGISQATASKHVQMLESWLGTRLLNRTTRQVGLTEAGFDFFAQCTRILEDMESARMAGQSTAPVRGTLRMTVPVGFGCIRLPALAAAFMAQHPELTVIVSATDRPVDLLEEDFDLAIRASSGQPTDPSLVVHTLAPLPFVICAAPDFIAVHGMPQAPADLARFDCLFHLRHPGEVWRFNGPDGETEIRVGGRFKTDNSMLRCEAAVAGAGVLLTPEHLVAEHLAAGRLLRLLPDYTPPGLRLEAISPSYRAMAPKVRQFVAFLAARLRQ